MKPIRSAFAIVLLAAACTRTPSPSPDANATNPKLVFVQPDPPTASGLPDATADAIDADMVKSISDFSQSQTGYQAALQSYAQIQRLSLFNYIS